MEYSKILKRAAEITWRHKALWLFGFLLALFSGGGGAGQGVQYRLGPSERLPVAVTVGLVLLVIALVLVFIVIAVLIGNLSRAALIGMVGEVEETGNTSVRSGWRIGASRMLRLIGIDLAIGIPMVILVIALVIMGLSPLLLTLPQRKELTALGIMLTVLFMLLVIGLLIVAGIALSTVAELAYRQCVLERNGIFDSIRDGFHVWRANLKQVGVIWLLLFGIDLAVGIVAIPLSLAVLAVASGPAVATYAATKAVAAAVLTGFLIGLPGFLLLVLLAGIHQAFRSATWTLAYRDLAARVLVTANPAQQ